MYKVYIVYNISLTLINNTMHIQLIQANPYTQSSHAHKSHRTTSIYTEE